MASSLTALTKKNIVFKWEEPEQNTFESIKKAFSIAPILQHFDLDKECVLKLQIPLFFYFKLLYKKENSTLFSLIPTFIILTDQRKEDFTLRLQTDSKL